MQALEQERLRALDDRLRDATEMNGELLAQVIEAACRRFPSTSQSAKTERIGRLMESSAWTDAVLALIDLELPLWKARRIVYDEGEWQCALSRQRELPDWLDQSIEARHEDLAIAMLRAFVEARRISAPSVRPSVPSVNPCADLLDEIVCCDNYA